MIRGEPYKYDALLRFKAERERGIAHTPEWQAKMAEQQAAFDAEQAHIWQRCGGAVLGCMPPIEPFECKVCGAGSGGQNYGQGYIYGNTTPCPGPPHHA